jgi:rod shape determining protein RodA
LLLFGHFVDVNQSNFSRRWVRIPLLDFSAQPSEFMKLAYVAAMARYLMFRKNYRSFAGLAAPAAMTLGPAALILLEPDLGTALLFPPVFFVMLYVAGARRRHLAALGALGLALMLMAFFADNITGALAGRGIVFSKSVAALKPYQKARITSFVQNTSYQQRQSVMAVGSGKLFGKGWRQGTQNRYNLLPERHTDFIFAVVAEESGFLGCIGLLALYFVILLCSFAVASRTSDPFARLLVTGLFASFAVQMFINAAMTLRLMPITGLTLPLVSYGGSSLTATMLAIALIMNVRLHPTPTFASKVFDFDET